MATYISMLRGVNVGAAKKMNMEALRQAYAGLGLERVQSYVQSGNVVFEGAGSEGALAGQIEAQIEAAFGFSTQVFVRSVPYFERIIAANPFVPAGADISRLHVTFFYSPVAAEALGSLGLPANAGDDRFAPAEGAVYLFCPNGYGKTRLSNDLFERKLRVAATTRNWNTVNALYQLASQK